MAIPLLTAIRKAARTRNIKELDRLLALYKSLGYKTEALFETKIFRPV